jgi:6-phosphogluconolactonase
VSMYAINATSGALASTGTIAAGADPVFVAVDPSGKFAYVTNSGSNDVSMYTINATTGALTSIGTIAAESAPTSIAIHPAGQFAYVTNSGSNDVSMYSIGSTGTLTLIGTIGT